MKRRTVILSVSSLGAVALVAVTLFAAGPGGAFAHGKWGGGMAGAAVRRRGSAATAATRASTTQSASSRRSPISRPNRRDRGTR